VTLKSTANRAFAEAAAPLLGPDTAVVFVQNGIPWWYAHGLGLDRPPPPDLGVLDPGGALHRLIGPQRVIGAVIYTSNEVTAPGVVTNDSIGANSLILGEPDDSQSPRVRGLRAALAAAGIGSPDCTDIRATLWRRLIVNMAGSVLCMVVEEPIGWVQGDAALGGVYGLVARDGAAIAAAHGIDVETGTMPAYGTPRFPPAHKPSILQDYERRRSLEIDGLLAVPLAFAAAARIETPALSVLAAIATSRARSRHLYPLRAVHS
jgi:2-dehydropantoate 2-reductase